MHEGQVRQSGDPYFSHPIAVAAILTEQRLDDATLITALLHDTIEDTKSTFTEVSQLFGPEVADFGRWCYEADQFATVFCPFENRLKISANSLWLCQKICELFW